MLNAAPGPCSLSQYLQDGQENTLHVIYFLFFKTFLFCIGVCMCAKSLQSCPTLCNPMDCSLLGSSVHRILQAKNTGAVCLLPPPGDLPDPGTEPLSLMSPALAGGFFTTSTTWETSLQKGCPTTCA